MHQGIAHEEFIAPELTLPIQFRDIWHGPLASSPERILAVSVLGQAANDLQTFRFARRRGRQRLYLEAYQWVASNDRSWPYAFLNLCDGLRLAAESVRIQLLGDAPSVALAQLRRASRVTSGATSNGGAAMVFRFSRPANVTSTMVARASVGKCHPRGLGFGSTDSAWNRPRSPS